MYVIKKVIYELEKAGLDPSNVVMKIFINIGKNIALALSKCRRGSVTLNCQNVLQCATFYTYIVVKMLIK